MSNAMHLSMVRAIALPPAVLAATSSSACWQILARLAAGFYQFQLLLLTRVYWHLAHAGVINRAAVAAAAFGVIKRLVGQLHGLFETEILLIARHANADGDTALAETVDDHGLASPRFPIHLTAS